MTSFLSIVTFAGIFADTAAAAAASEVSKIYCCRYSLKHIFSDLGKASAA